MEKRYQVFVSSTYEDLKDERAAVIKCLLDNNCIPVGMEQFPASSMSQWEYIQKMMEYTDYYILITAGKYGSIDTSSENRISYTEREYDYAKEKGIHILSFVLDKNADPPGSKIETDTERKLMLENFQRKVTSEKLVSFYNGVSDLQAKVATAINQAIKNSPAIGWVRADEISVKSNEQQMSNEIAALKKQINQMPKIKVGHGPPNVEDCPNGSIYLQID